jgi:hypothetical protein
MEFNEDMPKGGWLKYRRRQEMIERIKVAGMMVALVAAYSLVGYIEMGM